jgi:mannosyltransferase OCH1-like enzyme
MSGAAKADLWRLLILWEYGGEYTDIDIAPGPVFKNGTAISDDDDSFFVIERIGTLSQYFMAASPKHPLIHIAITETLKRILDIGTQNVACVSGPEVIRQSMTIFMRSEGTADQYQRISKG